METVSFAGMKSQERGINMIDLDLINKRFTHEELLDLDFRVNQEFKDTSRIYVNNTGMAIYVQEYECKYLVKNVMEYTDN